MHHTTMHHFVTDIHISLKKLCILEYLSSALWEVVRWVYTWYLDNIVDTDGMVFQQQSINRNIVGYTPMHFQFFLWVNRDNTV